MKDLAANLLDSWSAGTVVLLEGPLGAGKTTFVRGVLESLGHVGAVRSPTFNLLHEYATTPPVIHADLYRLGSSSGLGLEEFFDTHLCLIEWPDRLVETPPAWRISIGFGDEENDRWVTCTPPNPP